MIKLQNVYKVYENAVIAIRDISLDLPQKGMVAIVGESGCGKSTMLNLLSNNDTPSKGELSYNGVVYQLIDRQVLTRDFAYIYQDFKLIENMTVYQNIMIGHELANNNIDHDRVIAVADELCIADLLDQKVYALSGGQMQRVAIARALARNPKVIFADEPSGNLDSYNSENICKILKEISADCLVVIVTHDININMFADRIIRLSDGKIVEDLNNEYAIEHIELVKNNNKNKNTDTLNDGTTSLAKLSENNDKTSASEFENKSRTDCDDINCHIQLNDRKNTPNIKKNSIPKIKISTVDKIFTYRKGTNKERKKAGLSAKSIGGLAVAFNNKGIVKRVVLTAISIVMVALIMMSSSMIFSNFEQTFVNSMKKNKNAFVGISILNRLKNYNSTEQDIDKVNGYIEDKYNAEVYVSGARALNYNFYGFDVSPDVTSIPRCYNGLLFSNMNEIYINDPTQLGIHMAIGTTPVAENEIAISMTYYNYMMQVGKFERKVFVGNNEVETETVEFKNQKDLIGKYIKEFNFTITGVFEDNYKYSDAKNVPNNVAVDTFAEMRKNRLIGSIIRPESVAKNTQYFNNEYSDYKLVHKYHGGYVDAFIGYIPSNKVTSDYYHTNKNFNIELATGEIIINDRGYLDKLENELNKKINVGDTIDLTLTKTEKKNSMDRHVVEEYQTKTFKIVNIATDYYSERPEVIIMNDNDYSEWVKEIKVNSDFLISSKFVTAEFMRDVNDYYYKNIATGILDKNQDDFYISYEMDNFDSLDIYSTGFIKIMNKYVGLPLLIVASIILAMLISIILSDMIKAKGNEILLLKSIGAKTGAITKIFGTTTLLIATMQLAVGLLLGYGLLSLFNYFTAVIGNYSIYYDTFWIGWANTMLSFVAVIAVNMTALFYSVSRLNGKNLRKSFQKQKK